MTTKEITEKLKHVQLSLYAHPENQPNSEMADCLDTLGKIIAHIEKLPILDRR
jgi:hypothetical protein